MSDTKRAVGRPKSNESRAEGRPSKRIPVSGHRDVLTVEGKEDGFYYRWVNDVDNRLNRFLAGGYEFVDHDVSVGIRTVDNPADQSSRASKPVGKGVVAYLMRIPFELYDEDQAAKQKTIDETELSMKQRLNNGSDGTYGKVEIG